MADRALIKVRFFISHRKRLKGDLTFKLEQKHVNFISETTTGAAAIQISVGNCELIALVHNILQMVRPQWEFVR
jgi:ribosomal protein S4E